MAVKSWKIQALSDETDAGVNFTEEQTQTLLKLKESMKEQLTERYDDVMLARFLIARQFDIEKTAEMIKKDIEWRKEVNIDELMETLPKTEWFQKITDYYPGKTHGVDKHGVAVQWERIPTMDPKSYMGSVPYEEITKHHIYSMESQERIIRENMSKTGKYRFRRLVIEDAGGCGMRHLHTEALTSVKECLQIDEAHYPEGLRVMYIFNAPKVFNLIYKLVSPHLDKRTVAKLRVIDDIIAVLKNEMEEKYWPAYINNLIPCCLKCKPTTAKYNGCIPDAGIFGSPTAPPSEDEHHEVTISASDKHLHEINVDKSGTLLGWEFSSESHDVGFAVHLKNEDGQLEEVVPYSRAPTGSDSVAVTSPGRYVVTFDNTFSYLRKKTVKYQLTVTPPIEKKKKKKNKKKHHK